MFGYGFRMRDDPPARERRPWGSISRAQIVAAALDMLIRAIAAEGAGREAG
jgi:hypothetical protein